MTDGAEKKDKLSSALAVVKDAGAAGLETTEAIAIAATLSGIVGAPVPPTMVRNLIKSINELVSNSLDVANAWLLGKAHVIRAESDAKAAFAEQSVGIAVRELGADSALAQRAMHSLGKRMLREQQSREKILRDAVEDLKADPPKQDAPAEVDEDWLHLFSRHAETKTNADVQAYFARVLAGEIRKPGSFSPETIEVLARITPPVGQLFQQFCNATIDVVAAINVPVVVIAPALYSECFGSAGTNALVPAGLSFQDICRLNDAGLVRSDLTVHREMAFAGFFSSRLAGKPFGFLPSSPEHIASMVNNKGRQHAIVVFTAAGEELRRIVHMMPNEVYAAKFVEWAARNNLVPNPKFNFTAAQSDGAPASTPP